MRTRIRRPGPRPRAARGRNAGPAIGHRDGRRPKDRSGYWFVRRIACRENCQFTSQPYDNPPMRPSCMVASPQAIGPSHLVAGAVTLLLQRDGRLPLANHRDRRKSSSPDARAERDERRDAGGRCEGWLELNCACNKPADHRGCPDHLVAPASRCRRGQGDRRAAADDGPHDCACVRPRRGRIRDVDLLRFLCAPHDRARPSALPGGRACQLHQLLDRAQSRRHRIHRRGGAVAHLLAVGTRHHRRREDRLRDRTDLLAGKRVHSRPEHGLRAGRGQRREPTAAVAQPDHRIHGTGDDRRLRPVAGAEAANRRLWRLADYAAQCSPHLRADRNRDHGSHDRCARHVCAAARGARDRLRRPARHIRAGDLARVCQPCTRKPGRLRRGHVGGALAVRQERAARVVADFSRPLFHSPVLSRALYPQLARIVAEF